MTARLPAAVLFDLDGTLVDSAPAIADAINEVLRARNGESVPVQKVRTYVSRGASELISACFGAVATTPELDLAEFRTVYSRHRANPSDLYPHAVETLRALAGSGFQLGICTNKPQGLTERLLDGLEIASLFRVVVGGDRCPRPKPHPDHLHFALDEIGLNSQLAVYVGDSEVDAEAAQKAQIPFILADYGYAIGSLAAIPHLARMSRLDQLGAILRNMAAWNQPDKI